MTLHHSLRAAVQQQAAGSTDDYFKNVSLLLTGDGTNGAQNNTFLDSSSNAFTITRNGNTTQGTFSPYGSLWSNYFDGSGDYLNAGQQTAFDLGSGAYTVECFVCVTDLSTLSCVFDYSNPTRSANGDSAYRIDVTTTGSVETTWTTGASTAIYLTSANGLIQVGKWAHIAVVRNSSGNWSLFVDGTRAATSTNTNTMYTPASRNFKIGQESTTNPTRNFDGYISNFRLVKGSAVYDPTASTLTVPTTPLTAVSGTSLLTCQSNRFIDNSSNNFAITVNGNTSVQRFSPFNPTAPYSASTIGGSGYFDGSGDFLDLPSNSVFDPGTSGDWSVEFFAYSTGNGGSILGNKGGGSATKNGWDFNFQSNLYFRYYYPQGTELVSTGVSVVNNTWYHIVVCRNSSRMSMFLNGTRVWTTTTNLAITAASNTFKIGKSNDTSADNFPGYISNVRLLKGSTAYNPDSSTITVPTAPLATITNTSLLCNFTNSGIPDLSMQNDLETVGNAQVSTSVKKYGTGSLAFDGTGDTLKIISTPNLAFGTGDFTVEFWAYSSTLASQTGAIYANAVSGGFYVYVDSGSVVVRIYGVSTLITAGSLSNNTWTHIAVTRSGTSVKLFINGTQAGSTATSSQNFAQNATYIGTEDGSAQAYVGYIDDLRITKGYARYTANFTPPTAALPTY